MDERRIARQYQDSEKYKEKYLVIRKRCIEAKEKWFNKKCEEIELLSQKNPQLIHEKVNIYQNLKMYFYWMYQREGWPHYYG